MTSPKNFPWRGCYISFDVCDLCCVFLYEVNFRTVIKYEVVSFKSLTLTANNLRLNYTGRGYYFNRPVQRLPNRSDI